MFKKLLLFSLFILPLSAFSQDTIFVDKKGNTVKSIDFADSYKVILPDSNSATYKIEKVYSLSGQIKSERRYFEKESEKSDKKAKVFDGTSKFWFENGQLKREINYKQNQYHGNLLTYWENGQPKRKDFYENDKLVEGICYDSLGNTIEYFPFEIMPQFPGGQSNLVLFLKTNIRYPVNAQRNKIQGRVITEFVVDAEGKIVDLKIVRSVNWELDAEALRVIHKMPDWIPGVQDGIKVRVKYTLPVNFRLN